MEYDDLPGDGQPKPCAPCVGGAGPVRPVELVKEGGKDLVRHILAPISDFFQKLLAFSMINP